MFRLYAVGWGEYCRLFLKGVSKKAWHILAIKRRKVTYALHKKSLHIDFSVQPLCSLCLGGVFCLEFVNHRDTENTEVAQRRVIRR